MLLAYRCAVASPRVRAAAVEATEFPHYADEHAVLAVPRVVVDGSRSWEGVLPEREFVERLTGLTRDPREPI